MKFFVHSERHTNNDWVQVLMYCDDLRVWLSSIRMPTLSHCLRILNDFLKVWLTYRRHSSNKQMTKRLFFAVILMHTSRLSPLSKNRKRKKFWNEILSMPCQAVYWKKQKQQTYYKKSCKFLLLMPQACRRTTIDIVSGDITLHKEIFFSCKKNLSLFWKIAYSLVLRCMLRLRMWNQSMTVDCTRRERY